MASTRAGSGSAAPIVPVEGADMATWDEIRSYMRTRYRLLEEDESLRLRRVREVRAAAEFDAVLGPLLAPGVREQLVDRRADGDDAHGVGVHLAEHRA